MTFENYVKARLADFAVQEGARYGGERNMLAAAQVISNRVRAGWHGGDWLAVIEDAPKKAGTIYPGRWVVDIRDRNFRNMLIRIDDVYHGNIAEDATAGALFYAELHNITQPWFLAHITQGPTPHASVAKVGEVTFFS